MTWRKNGLLSYTLLMFALVLAACSSLDAQEGVDLPEGGVSEKRIAFVSARDGNYNIYVMDRDGTGQTRLTHNPASDWSPAWSPDGTKIAFVSDRDGNLEIYVMNSDGSEQTRLTQDPADDFAPAWSSDGTKIIFESDRDGKRAIYVMDADGAGQSPLTDGLQDDFNPVWQP